MRLRGGYLPRIAGRPAASVRSVPVPDRLCIDLRQGTLDYTAAAGEGTVVRFGDALAWAEVAGGRIALPAPAAGIVAVEPGRAGAPSRLLLTVTDPRPQPCLDVAQPERVSAEGLRRALALGGLWPLIWSSKTNGPPPLDGSEAPRRILVNCVAAEPFRTRGKVILRDERAHVAAGVAFLQRLLAEYGAMHLVITDPSDPVAVSLREEMTGRAWIRIECAPLRYPIEHPRILCRALRDGDARVAADEAIWTLDIQAVAALGACLGEGLPLHERIVAVGGPGASVPEHRRVRIGTRLDAVLDASDLAENRRVLRGGLFQGAPVDAAAAVGYADDAFFVLPRPAEREFLGFVRPGFDRVSMLPCFASRLTGAADRRLTTALRGERRPCIACGLCETVCPVNLLPQMLHRCLYRQAIEEAETLGLHRCIGCGLCAYGCPSKLDLAEEFAAASRRLAVIRAETEEAERTRRQRDETRKAEQDRKDEWRT